MSKNKQIVMCAFFLFVASAARAGTILHVDDDAATGGDGATWANAFAHLQDALASASNPANGVSEIRVAQGMYYPDRNELNPLGTGDRAASFQLLDGVALLGGYAGLGAPDPDARDVTTNQTVLTGDLNDDDLPDFVNNGENSYHVLTTPGAGGTSRIDGFIVRSGNADGITDQGEGGGLRHVSGHIDLLNTTFQGNWAKRGGGLFLFGVNTSASLGNCTIEAGFAAERGGGIASRSSDVTLTNCSVVGNATGDKGGGIWRKWGIVTLVDSSVTANVAVGAGGGAYSENSGNLTMSGSTVSQNSVTSDLPGYGGGLIAINSTITLNSCTFSGNDAPVGGAIAMFDATVDIADCMFRECTAGAGGAIEASSSDLSVVRSAFIGNAAESAGGAIQSVTGSNALIVHAHFIGNSAGGAAGAYDCGAGHIVFVGCVFAGNDGGEFGGALTSFQAIPDVTVINSSFSGNVAAQGAGIFLAGSSPGTTLTNCILWGNESFQGTNESAQLSAPEPGAFSVNHSAIQGLTGSFGGVGNTGADPMFIDADGADNLAGTEDDDLRLAANSPLIDAGDNNGVPADILTDLDGNPRFVDDPNTPDSGTGTAPLVDLGAYELLGGGQPIPTVSQWGFAAMMLLLLTAATAVFGKCRPAPSSVA